MPLESLGLTDYCTIILILTPLSCLAGIPITIQAGLQYSQYNGFWMDQGSSRHLYLVPPAALERVPPLLSLSGSAYLTHYVPKPIFAVTRW